MSRLKKLFVLLCVMSFTAVLMGCSTAESSETGSDTSTAEFPGSGSDIPTAESPRAENDISTAETIEHIGEQVPELGQVQGICELATMECYYHNIAKSSKEPGTGVLHFGERERSFWIEYTGAAEISFRADLIKMEQHGKEIIITLPSPEITCTVDPDSWDEDSYVISKDQWIQKNPITAEDQTLAINAAQADMQEKVENNPSIMNNARMQAQELITNYIHQIGRLSGVDYQISWKNADSGSIDVQPSSAEKTSKEGEQMKDDDH